MVSVYSFFEDTTPHLSSVVFLCFYAGPVFLANCGLKLNRGFRGVGLFDAGYDTCPEVYPPSAYAHADAITKRGAAKRTTMLAAAAEAKKAAHPTIIAAIDQKSASQAPQAPDLKPKAARASFNSAPLVTVGAHLPSLRFSSASFAILPFPWRLPRVMGIASRTLSPSSTNCTRHVHSIRQVLWVSLPASSSGSAAKPHRTHRPRCRLWMRVSWAATMSWRAKPQAVALIDFSRSTSEHAGSLWDPMGF